VSEAAGHYFATNPVVGSRPAAIELHLPDLSLRLTTDRGVFAAGGVDPGTKLLLLEGPAPAGPSLAPGANLVDLGCGYGPIALALARRAPAATVWAVDVNERARDLCAANAATNGLGNVVVVAPEEVPAGLAVAGLWSNPPIRIGKAALHELLVSWLDRLAVPPGEAGAWLVVQRHLGADSLTTWLTAGGWPTTRLRSRQAYRLLEVHRGATVDDRPGDA
jgi:16S rRNA (guanine1207-N2)-methyltransferase